MRNGNTAGSRQAFLRTSGHPSLVFGQREALVDLFHGHQLFLPPPPMCPGHGGHIDRFAVLIVLLAAIALIVSEAVLDANDDPAADQQG